MVTHPITDHTLRCLTTLRRREVKLPTQDGRTKWSKRTGKRQHKGPATSNIALWARARTIGQLPLDSSTSEDQGEVSSLSTRHESGREEAWPPINQLTWLKTCLVAQRQDSKQRTSTSVRIPVKLATATLDCRRPQRKVKQKRGRYPPQEASQLATSTETANQSRKQQIKSQVFCRAARAAERHNKTKNRKRERRTSDREPTLRSTNRKQERSEPSKS